MSDEEHAEELANALSDEEEITLGPTDLKACATALRYYARRSRRRAVAGAFAFALACAARPALDLNRDGSIDRNDLRQAAHLALRIVGDDERVFDFDGRRVRLVFERGPRVDHDLRVKHVEVLSQ